MILDERATVNNSNSILVKIKARTITANISSLTLCPRLCLAWGLYELTQSSQHLSGVGAVEMSLSRKHNLRSIKLPRSSQSAVSSHAGVHTGNLTPAPRKQDKGEMSTCSVPLCVGFPAALGQWKWSGREVEPCWCETPFLGCMSLLTVIFCSLPCMYACVHRTVSCLKTLLVPDSAQPG